jgi:hypothetical protein
MSEILNYTLQINLPILGLQVYEGLNADEVVELAHEYGIAIPYEVLPELPGRSVNDIDWAVSVPIVETGQTDR